MNNPNEQQYLDALEGVFDLGREKTDRTGVGTYSRTGVHMRFNLAKGFPLLTTKKMFWKGIVAELLWMLSGSTNVRPLQEQGVHIWDEWADEDGELGPIYGKQWRRWSDPKADAALQLYFDEIDQVANVIEGIKSDPLSRRHVITTWNPAEIDAMALPPCHGIVTQFVCEPLTYEERAQMCAEDPEQFHGKTEARRNDLLDWVMEPDSIPRYRLSCLMQQRSGDMFLGVPFNIASYSLLTHMIAAECNMVPGEFVHTIGDAHIYCNHVDQVREQLSRRPYPAPAVSLKRHYDSFDRDGASFSVLGCRAENIILSGYWHHPAIKAPVAV